MVAVCYHRESMHLQRTSQLRASALRRTGSGSLAMPGASLQFHSPQKQIGPMLSHGTSNPLSLEQAIAMQMLQAPSSKNSHQHGWASNTASEDDEQRLNMPRALKSAFASASGAAPDAGIPPNQQLLQMHLGQQSMEGERHFVVHPAKHAVQRSSTIHLSDGAVAHPP